MEFSVAPLSREAFLGAIAYFLLVPAIALLLIAGAKRNLWVRFHAWQSLLVAAGTIVSAIVTRLLVQVLAILPFGILLGWLLAGVVSLAIVFLWIAIVVKAALGDAYELPFIGRWARVLAGH